VSRRFVHATPRRTRSLSHKDHKEPQRLLVLIVSFVAKALCLGGSSVQNLIEARVEPVDLTFTGARRVAAGLAIALIVDRNTLTMSTRIRPAVVGDEELLAHMNRFVQDLHLAQRPDHFRPTGSEELARWYRLLLEKPTTRLWIAEEDGLPVGYLLALVHEVPENPFVRARRWCEIDQLAVDPNRRRRGIGRGLLLNAVSTARAEGISRVEAASWSFNDGAQAVFRRLGFVPKITRFELKPDA
jgi:diamine N-acetyltransferase